LAEVQIGDLVSWGEESLGGRGFGKRFERTKPAPEKGKDSDKETRTPMTIDAEKNFSMAVIFLTFPDSITDYGSGWQD